MKTVIQEIASTLTALRNCQERNSPEGVTQWKRRLRQIENEILPSGSGIDRGTQINEDESNDNRIVLNVDFHHMNEGGFYCGWSSHQIIISPDFNGINIRVTGRDKRQIKEYLGDLFQEALSAELERYQVEKLNGLTTYVK